MFVKLKRIFLLPSDFFEYPSVWFFRRSFETNRTRNQFSSSLNILPTSVIMCVYAWVCVFCVCKVCCFHYSCLLMPAYVCVCVKQYTAKDRCECQNIDTCLFFSHWMPWNWSVGAVVEYFSGVDFVVACQCVRICFIVKHQTLWALSRISFQVLMMEISMMWQFTN